VSKYDEFNNKVGKTENHYCGNCRNTKPHIWTKKKRDPYLLASAFYEFYLKCKNCGKEDMIYTTE